MVKGKGSQKSTEKVRPMPSIIISEGSFADSEFTEPKSQVDNEAEIKVEKILSTDPYNPKANRLMWFGVIFMTVIIFALWAWALAFQFSTTKWSKTPEKSFYELTKENWRQSFTAGNSTADIKSEIRYNLAKLIAGMSTTTPEAAASSTATSTNP